MFLRFVRPNLVKGMAARSGFFTAAFDLRNAPETSQHTAAQVSALLDWFNLNLPRRTTFTRSASKGSYRADFTKGLSWFRPDATQMIARSRDLAALLQDNGYPVETLRTARPGYVLYKDTHQIIAEPFSDTPA